MLRTQVQNLASNTNCFDVNKSRVTFERMKDKEDLLMRDSFFLSDYSKEERASLLKLAYLNLKSKVHSKRLAKTGGLKEANRDLTISTGQVDGQPTNDDTATFSVQRYEKEYDDTQETNEMKDLETKSDEGQNAMETGSVYDEVKIEQSNLPTQV